MDEELSKVIGYINEGNYKKAEIILLNRLSKDPENYILNKLLGTSLIPQQKYNGAVKSLTLCYNKDNTDSQVLTNLSYLYLKVQEYESSIRFAQKAIKINSNNPSPYQNIAQCNLALLKFNEAKEMALTAITLRKKFQKDQFYQYTDLINLYADILLAKKDIKEFVIFSHEVLDNNFNGDIFRKLLNNNPKDIKTEHLNKIKDRIKNPEKFSSIMKKNSALSSMHFCLAEYYSLTDKNKSEQNYIKANNYISEMQRTSLYLRQKRYINLINFFIHNNFTNFKEIDPKKGRGLIFIFGMPRSGTTLTESILSTAENLIAGGERVYFAMALNSIIEEIGEIKNAKIDFFEQLGDMYLKSISTQRGGTEFFVDKLPDNYLYLPFIKLALPSAKFIHTYRDPWDNAISLFKVNYQTSLYYASSFFGIANEYANYQNIMRFWRHLFDEANEENSILDIEYEDLVTNKDKNIKKIWSFCGVSGKFSYEKRKSHYANTASQLQVTKDIFTSSLKKTDFKEFKEKFHQDLIYQNEYWSKKMLNLNSQNNT